ncbi:hypothetical protein GGH96_003274 [Coemansia sp. RSA 1972]|nr:hypothetical protein GGH96_003274 [Coemansia sp. RSA 1972]
MLTDYSNNIMLQFGDTWQGAVNTLLKCKQRQTELVAQLEETLGTGQPIPTSDKGWEIVQLLWPVLCSYSVGYRFAKQSLYYNVKPHIIKYWGWAVDLEQVMFRSQKGHQFLGFAMTDGVSISVVCETKEEPTETSAKHTCDELQQPEPEQLAAQQVQLSYQLLLYQLTLPSVLSSYVWQSQQLLSQQPPQLPVQQPPPQTQPVQWWQKQADCAYISKLSKEQLQSTARQCVLVDPGRQDLLFMLHEESIVDDKNIYRYTCNQQHQETCIAKYREIREHVKKVDVADITVLERTLSAGSFIKPDLALFEVYLAARAKVAVELTRHYNETMCWQQVGATTPMVPLHQKLRLSAYVNQQRADQLLMNRLQERFSPDAVFILGNWGASMAKFHEPIRGKGWRTLLKRAGFDVYLIDEYLTSKTCPICEEHISTFHKVKNPRPWMRTKRPMVKCHGLLGCQSQTCMEFFDTYQRGYLGKEEDKKKGEEGRVKWRLWNWDLAAVLNFRKILFSLRETGTVPTCFQRKQQPTDVSKSTARKRKQPTDASKAPKTTARKTTTFQTVNAV